MNICAFCVTYKILRDKITINQKRKAKDLRISALSAWLETKSWSQNLYNLRHLRLKNIHKLSPVVPNSLENWVQRPHFCNQLSREFVLKQPVLQHKSPYFEPCSLVRARMSSSLSLSCHTLPLSRQPVAPVYTGVLAVWQSFAQKKSVVMTQQPTSSLQNQ